MIISIQFNDCNELQMLQISNVKLSNNEILVVWGLTDKAAGRVSFRFFGVPLIGTWSEGECRTET